VALLSRLAALCALALFALATPAGAGPPGSWTKVTNFDSEASNSDEVGVARTGDGLLHVLWTQDTAVLSTRLSANAESVRGTRTVFTYGGAVGDVALLPTPSGGLRAFFSGLFDGDPHDVGMSTATSPDGVTWTVQPTLASDAREGNRSPVYAAAGIGGTLFDNGTPLSIWGDSAPGAAAYHVGTGNQTPDVHFRSDAVTVGSPEAATDSATGDVAVGWNDFDSGSTLVGLVQQTIDPWFPLGATTTPPGGNAADPLFPVGMTGRSGGASGIFVAYLRGTNQFDSKPAVWRVGASGATNLSGADARYPGVTMGPDGRLWAFWAVQGETWDIHARRSNAAATQWGEPVDLDPPAGTSTVWSLKGDGSAAACGALDIVALATAGNDTANYHQRVLPGLTLKKKVLNGGRGETAKVRFRASDAGEPVDATIRFGAKQADTGDDGKVKLKLKRRLRTRKVRATATDGCYTADTLRVKVKKLRQ